MQTKSISKQIKTKLSEWIDSINDTALREDVKKDLLVTGGSIASLYLGEAVNDYDIYFTNRNTLLNLVNYYLKAFISEISVLDGSKKQEYINQYKGDFSEEEFLKHNSHTASAIRTLKPDQIKLFIQGGGGFKVEESFLKEGTEDTLKYQPAYFSPNAISLTDDIQIVIRFFGTPEEIHKTFDFIHATNYFTFNAGVVINTAALESLLTKQLKYQGSLYPVTSIIRCKKFIKRGFNISAGEMLKMIFQASQLDLTDMDVLEEQLIGVDVAYFAVLIDALKNKQESDPSFKITPEYFSELIDRVFNQYIDQD